MGLGSKKVTTSHFFQNERQVKMRYISEMERDATWMSENTWAAKHGSANLNLWYEMQYNMRVNSKPWWDDSDMERDSQVVSFDNTGK